MNEPTHFDICSGIGGFSVAFEAARFRTIGFAEILPLPSAVLKRHWPNVPNLGDIRRIGKDSIERPNILTGGIPCEPASLAGKRRGESDERWLWSEVVRLVRELRPEFAVFENPTGILTLDGGYAFERILCAIHASGYACWWETIPAFAVGADHERERVFITCISHDFRFQLRFNQTEQERGSKMAGYSADADSQRELQRQGNANALRVGRQGLSQWGSICKTEQCGAPADANAVGIGDEWGRIERQYAAGEWSSCLVAGLSESPSNSDSAGLEKRESKCSHDGEKLPPIERDARLTLPETDFSLLREIHGLSPELDRRSRIEALGKTVVPAVIYPIANAIRQFYP